MKNIFLTLCTLVILFSCEKKDDISILTNQVNQDSLKVKDGIIHFKSDSIFYSTCLMISKMNDTEFKDWENKIGFKSLRNELIAVYNKIEKCEDSVSLENILIDNRDILKVVDSFIIPNINSSIYTSIINREGIFYINDVIYKVDGSKIAISIDGKIETVDNALTTNTLKSSNSNVFVIEYSKDESIQLKSTTYGHTTIEKDKYGNYRLCRVQMICYNLYTIEEERIYPGGGSMYYTVVNYIDETVVEVKVKNYKKSWGKYRPYKTTCEMRNIEYTIEAAMPTIWNTFTYGNHTGTMENKSSGSSEVEELNQVNLLGNRIYSRNYGSSNLTGPVFIRARASATNRGIGAIWASIVVGN